LNVLFVLLLSFSKSTAQNSKQIAGELSAAFGVQAMCPQWNFPMGTNIHIRQFFSAAPPGAHRN